MNKELENLHREAILKQLVERARELQDELQSILISIERLYVRQEVTKE